jgi:uncharacterized protein
MRRLEQADLIVHGGDFVAASVLEELCALGPVEAVHGNMDDAALRALLPAELVIETGGARIGLVHNGGPRAGRDARLAARFPSCSAVVYGHSHMPQVSRHENVLILNPGSPTDRRRAPEHTMIELEIEDGELQPTLITL